MIYDTELNYKEICELMEDCNVVGGRNREQQFNRWCKQYLIERPKRGKYIVKRELTSYEKGIACRDYRVILEDFCNKRHINILSEINDQTNGYDEVEYICPIHNNIVQKTNISRLLSSIGCPLCRYPMSRLEVMLYLGMPNTLHRNKLDGVEFDIILPKEKIAVEVDGMLYHSGIDEKAKEEHKYKVAEANGYKLIKIYEQTSDNNKGTYRDGDKIYMTPYILSTKEERKKIVETIQEILPYEHSEELWDKAADYMREWKYNIYKKNNAEQDKVIKQYNQQGTLVHEYKSFDEIKAQILTGDAFGFSWELENN